MLTVSFLVMSGWGLVNFYYDKRDLYLDLRQHTEVATNRLSHALVNPVWNLDDDEIRRIINYEAQNDKIRAVILRGVDGHLLAGCIKSAGSVTMVPENFNEKELAEQHSGNLGANAKVIKGTSHLATVSVLADDSPLKAKLNQRLYLSVTGIFLLCIGLSAALFLVLRITIVRPLEKLEDSVGHISIENIAIPIPVFGHDEIGRLADRFREMTAELQYSLEQQKQKEEQLLQAQKMEALGMLVSGISHDFNNILCAISGSTDLLSRRLKTEHLAEKGKIETSLATINSAVGRAATLIRQMLTLSMKHEVILSAVDLKETVMHVVRLLQSSLDKSINLHLDLPEVPAMVNSDPVQMEQVLLNLCINASHAMTIMRPDDDTWGGDLNISVKLIGADHYFHQEHIRDDENACWLVTVTDTGVGMDPSVKEHIFTPFYTTKQKGMGSGLGLSMVYSIIKQHHGDLTVCSEPGKGSSFHILLPALHDQTHDPEQADDPVKMPLPAGFGMILVIDDEDTIRENAFQILTECGYRVVLAENGDEGVRLARTHGDQIRLVLLDMIMPVLSGMDALPHLKAASPNAKVLLSSGFKQDPRVLALIAKGSVDDFIQKPYPLNQLAWNVHALLSLNEQQCDSKPSE